MSIFSQNALPFAAGGRWATLSVHPRRAATGNPGPRRAAAGNPGPQPHAVPVGAGYYAMACSQHAWTALRKPLEVFVAPATVSTAGLWASMTAGIRTFSMAGTPT